MRSRASFRGHPIHPMLIPFPLAFLVGGFVFDLMGTVLDNEELWVASYFLIPAGCVMGVVAAVPGIIDYLNTVPPASSARKRATKHGAINVSAVVLFGFSWLLRGGPGVAPDLLLLIFEGLGAIMLTIGGWMGGVLAFRNQIGVDHRYADAGKWKEERFPASTGWLRVGKVNDLKNDQMKLLRIGDRRLVLANGESGYVAFADGCTHRGGSLAGGVMACGRVVCPWHGSQFDVQSGKVTAGPAEEPIKTYPVEVRGDEVYVQAGE